MIIKVAIVNLKFSQQWQIPREDMVVDLRVSWPSSGSLDFRLKTENIPKMKLRLDWSTKMIMLFVDTC